MSHIPTDVQNQPGPNVEGLTPLNLDQLNAFLAKARGARPLTKRERIVNAEALAPMAAEDITRKVGVAYDAGRAAYMQDKSISSNPYSGDDRPLEWEAWCEGYESARAGYETDA